MLASLLQAAARRGARPEDGLQVLSAAVLPRRPFDPGWPVLLLPPGAEAMEGADAGRFDPPVLPGRAARGATPMDVLRALYPAVHPVQSLDSSADHTLETLTGADLAASAWLLPAVADELNTASPHGMPWLAARLRAPDGCPWDREQTHASLKKYLLEEAYEVYDALDGGAGPELAEELGDLFLQIVLHAQYAAEEGAFDLTDVYRSIMAKILRRHPHVFGDADARSVDQVLRNWERIKEAERAELAATRPSGRNGSGPTSDAALMPAAFAGLSRSLPALAYAQEMQERAASLGYDWPDIEGVIDKIEEEATELLAASNAAARREEFGDLLFVIVNLGRKLDVDAEAALRAASAKFAARFARVERLASEQGVELRSLGLDALDDLWQAAKSEQAAVMAERRP